MNLYKNKYQIVIGLEVHAQVMSKTKLFSIAPNSFGNEPNTCVDWLDAGMPGSLPVLNEACVDQAIKTGLSINGKINEYSVFDRKNYFYPDLPNGYQISQFYFPIVQNGYLDIELENGERKRITIQRIHLEQDAGKSTHDLNPKSTYVDFNRCGIGLMEIVTDPDMRSSDEAVSFMKKLRTLLKFIGTCDANMEEGSIRADANVSLCKPGDPFGTRCEIKNLNSLRFLKAAIEFEVERQFALLEEGKKILQETRLFNTKTGETVAMRSKEEAHDYRYFPDPDLPPLILRHERIQSIAETIPELPDAKKNRFMKDLELSSYDAELLSSDFDVVHFFEEALREVPADAKLLANWIITELFGLLKKENLEIVNSKISSKDLGILVSRIVDATISGKIAKQVFLEMWNTGLTPDEIIEKKDLKQISDPKTISNIIDSVLDDNQDKVSQYKAGKEQIFGYFVGTVLGKFQGKANPEMVNQILKEKLAH